MTPRNFAIGQLLVLTASHFMVDMLTGLIPGFLPVLREKFDLSIGGGVLLMTVCAFTSNVFQIPAGAMRRNSRRPFLIPLGLGMAGSITLIGVVGDWPGAVYWLFALALLVGVGVAFLHPEGLRGVCGISNSAFPAATATSVFMLFGFAGYATGPFLGGALVEWKGFSALWLLWLVIFPLMILSRKMGVRLATKPPVEEKGGMVSELSFSEIFLVAVFLNTGCNILSGLLPSWLNTFGFSLAFGGWSAMLFGIGAGIGALLLSFMIRKYNPLNCVIVSVTVGMVLVLVYFSLIETGKAAIFALLAGLFAGAGFPQLVVLARQAKNGPSLGMRMGVIVGGSWGVAGGLFLLVGVLADNCGLGIAMMAAPASFGIAAFLMWFLRRLHKRGEGI